MSIEEKLDLISSQLGKVLVLLGAKLGEEAHIRLFQWLDIWFDTYRAPRLKDKGYDLRNNINKHVRPNIKDKRLVEYTALDITAALNKVEGGRTRQIVYQIYNQAFREATRAGFIEKNPVEFVEHPKHKTEPGRSLSLDEQRIFLHTAKPDKLYILFRFYLLTGCRPSEPLGIKWSDVGGELLHIPGTKTDGADRHIPISEPLRELLKEIPKGNERLFPIVYHTVAEHLDKIRRGLPFSLTIKDLRHTFGTRCVESGVSLVTLQKWMGHSDYQTTVRTYVHVLSEFERSEIKKVGDLH